MLINERAVCSRFHNRTKYGERIVEPSQESFDLLDYLPGRSSSQALDNGSGISGGTS